MCYYFTICRFRCSGIWRPGSVACVLCENAGHFLTCLCSVAGCPADASSKMVRFFSHPFLERIAWVNTERREASWSGGHIKWQLNCDDPRRLRRSLTVTVSAEKKRKDANERMAVDMICVSPTAI